MAELTPEIIGDVLAACTEGAEKMAEALSRALDAEIAVSVGQPGKLDPEDLPEGLGGPGLAVVLTVGSAAALVLLPESSGLVPPWSAEPGPTAQSKLTTLAHELGMLVLPEGLMPEDGRAARVEDLAEALRRAGVAEGAGMVPLELSAGERQVVARVIWPAREPTAVLEAPAAEPQPAAPPEPAAESELAVGPVATAKPSPSIQPTNGSEAAGRDLPAGPKSLPPYTRSLLRIKVPVVVTLAEKRQPLRQILEMGAGSIIQFDKSCEEMLQLSVGDHRVADGEAVKVGDKFGLRITSIVLPDERFRPVRPL